MASGENIIWYVECTTKRGVFKTFLFRTWRKANSWKKANELKYEWIGPAHRATWGPA